MRYIIAIDVPDVTENSFVAYPFAVAKGVTYPIVHVIDMAADLAGLKALWIERKTVAKGIMATIRQNITESAMLIAICSPDEHGTTNPNVTYELGLADALGKPTLVMTTNIKLLPFDLTNRGAFTYSNDELTSETGQKNLAIRLAGALSELQRRRERARVILDDVVGTHALTARDGVVLEPPFWGYTQSFLTYVTGISSEIEGGMSWLERLSEDARSMLCGERTPLREFFKDWSDYRLYFAKHIGPILAESNLTDIRRELDKLTTEVGAENATGSECRRVFDDLCTKVSTHRDMYLPAEICVKDVQYGTKNCQALFGAIDPLKATADILLNTSSTAIRETVKRICEAFAARDNPTHPLP